MYSSEREYSCLLLVSFYAIVSFKHTSYKYPYVCLLGAEIPLKKGARALRPSVNSATI